MKNASGTDVFAFRNATLTGLMLVSVFLLAGCRISADQGLKEYYEARPYFGTMVSIHCYYDPALDMASIARKCWQKADDLQLNMNANGEAGKGDLARLNASGFEGVRVGQDVYQVIKQSLEYSRLTRGAYDVTVLPLVMLWKEAARQGHIPDKKALESAQEKVGYQFLRLQEPDVVFFMKKGMKVDLGSPASGYFCDVVADILTASGIQHFLVDGGGELFARGKNQGKTPWRIGIQDPFHKGKIISIVELKDQGVSTSGNYEKFYTIGTEKFSHIINPQTGAPQKNAVSVTVIASSAQAANELSTGLCVLGGEEGLKIIRTFKNVEALIVEEKDGKSAVYATALFQQPQQ